MKIQGEVISYGLTRSSSSRSDSGISESFKRQFDGYRVMFRYLCPCGEKHDSQALNVWPTGDHKTDTVKLVCPVTDEYNEVELTRPN